MAFRWSETMETLLRRFFINCSSKLVHAFAFLSLFSVRLNENTLKIFNGNQASIEGFVSNKKEETFRSRTTRCCSWTFPTLKNGIYCTMSDDGKRSRQRVRLGIWMNQGEKKTRKVFIISFLIRCCAVEKCKNKKYLRAKVVIPSLNPFSSFSCCFFSCYLIFLVFTSLFDSFIKRKKAHEGRRRRSFSSLDCDFNFFFFLRSVRRLSGAEREDGPAEIFGHVWLYHFQLEIPLKEETLNQTQNASWWE